jgi:hypothetical protein
LTGPLTQLPGLLRLLEKQSCVPAVLAAKAHPSRRRRSLGLADDIWALARSAQQAQA